MHALEISMQPSRARSFSGWLAAALLTAELPFGVVRRQESNLYLALRRRGLFVNK
jgi:hypothetical protein